MLRLRPWVTALVIFNAVAAFAAAPAPARSEAAANPKESYQAALDAMRESSKNALESLAQSSKIALDAAHHELEVLTTVYSAAAGLIAALVAFGAFLGWTTLKEARTEFQAKLDGVLGTAKSRVEQHFQESSGALRNRLAAMDQQLKAAEEAAAKTSERLAMHVAAATELVETSFFYVVNREVYYKTGGDAELTRRMERDLERLARLTTEFQSDRLRRLMFKEQAVLYCKRGALSKAIAAQREALALEVEPEADLYYNGLLPCDAIQCGRGDG